MNKKRASSLVRSLFSLTLIFCCLFVPSRSAYGASASGYSEYYIPGDEDSMMIILDSIGAGNQTIPNTMHSEITVTAWSDTTVVYYDHWEDGYDFDRDNPAATADEIVNLPNRGDSRTFTGFAITLPRAPAGTCSPAGTCFYDGRDRIFVAGGSATVTRASWTDMAGTLLAVAWEVYPVRPQLTTYIFPFGEDLNGVGLQDFERVFALVQATRNSTDITIDWDGDGTDDAFDPDRDGNCGNSVTSLTLNQGEVFMIASDTPGGDQGVVCPPGNALNTGTVVTGTDTLQVQYVIGDEGSNYEIRGLSAFPRGFWDDEYYAPVSGPAPATNDPVDIYLHNPHTTTLTISYETTTITGNFTIAPKSTVSFQAETGSYVPQNTAVYLSGDDVFWGVSTVDIEATTHDWGYSLVPAFLLETEHFMGWAPGSFPVGPPAPPVQLQHNDSGIYIAPAQDNVRVFVDFDNDGIADEIHDLDRLETVYVHDFNDGDLSEANIWATGPYTVAYGQNPDTSPPAVPAIDVGYTTIPGGDFMELVLTTDKTSDPAVVPTAAGSTTTFTVVVDSHDFSVDNINVSDLLPAGWAYVAGSTTITLADMTTVSGAPADPAVTTAKVYRDRFNGTNYTNNADNDAPLVWTTNWLEQGEGGVPAHTTGEIIITNDAGVTPTASVLRIEDNDSDVARMADLSGVAGAVLGFDYRASSIEAADEYVEVQVCQNAAPGPPITCGAGWATVVQVGGQNYAEYQHYEVNLAGILAAPNSATFAVRFTNQGGSGSGLDVGDFIYIDNVQITAGQNTLLWPSATLGSMGANQQIVIEFDAQTTTTFDIGDITRNVVEATGTRSVGAVTQTFVTSDFAFNSFGDLQLTKTSGGTDPLSPGDQYTYTVTVTNPATSPINITGISLYDPIPEGTSYVDNSSNVALSGVTANNFFYDFEAGPQGFTVGAAGGAPAMNWERGDPQTITPPTAGKCGANCFGGGPDDDHTLAGVNCWGTDLNDLYSNGIGAGIYLYTPIYDFTGMVSIQLSFWEWLEIEGNTYDIARLQREVGGGGWVDVWTYGVGAGAARTDTAWSEFVHNASAYAAGQNAVQWRWLITTDGSWQWGGWYIDDVLVQASSAATTPPFPGPAGDPPNFVPKSDGYFLIPGQTLTLTFDVTVDDPVPSGLEEIVNTVSLTTSEFPLPLTASVTNTVVTPSSETASVGDRVWLDADGDGVQDVGESGLANVEVTLKDQFGTPVATATTDVNGNYLFTGIAPGTGYYVEVTAGIPAGLVQSYPHSPPADDDKTDPFDLAAGDEHLTADLGYTTAPGSATLGDLVWSDADGDGARDPGEPGIGGVTVELWSDDGDTVFEPLSDDTLVATAITAADGSYLFTGVAASGTEDYFVYVDDTQGGPLAGYTATTAITQLNENVDAGDVLLNNDFGFRNAAGTHTIRDRVWYDVGEDEEDDGDTGIAGVTVALLDASDNVIATTTTDASGYFEFTGVPGAGADYTVQITDSGGILDDYFGTTAEALAGEIAIVNLAGDLDYTVEPTEPNFGYSLEGTVGDTIFNDLGGVFGVQDPGEPGLAGVTVEIYIDENNDGLLDGLDTLLSTDVTDASGTYLFSGLDDDDYVVSVTTPAGYAYTTESPDDDPAGGEQQATAIAGGSTDLTLDFGYRAIVARSVDGTIWDDADSGGDIDGGESLFENVTVDLYLDDGDGIYEPGTDDTLTGTTSTDASGDYDFSGLTPGSYWTVVTDTGSVLGGYDTTYEVTEGVVSPPYNGRELSDLTGGDVSNVNYGYNKPVPLLVVLARVRLFAEGGNVVARWETAAELGTLGFDVLRCDGAGGRCDTVNDRLLPAVMAAPQGGSYRFVDEGASPEGVYRYFLMERERGGKTRAYGPFGFPGKGKPAPRGHEAFAPFDAAGEDAGRAFRGEPRKAPKAQRSRLAKARSEKATRRLLRAATRSAGGSALKITVVREGLHFVSASQIAPLFGISERRARKMIRKGLFSLRNGGREISWLPAAWSEGLFFHGEEIDSLYTEENVYILAANRGKLMRETAGAAEPAPVGTFRADIHVEEDHAPYNSLASDPESDYWYWDILYGGTAGNDFRSYPFETPGVATGTGQASVTLNLQGASDASASYDHHLLVAVNGTDIGEVTADGIGEHIVTLDFDLDLLAEGGNTLEITALLDSGVPYSVVGFDSFDISYTRRRTAAGDALLLPGGEDPAVTVEGFSRSDLLVLDVTDPKAPVWIFDANVDDAAGSWRVSFAPSSPARRYLAVSAAASSLPAVEPFGSSSLRDPALEVDYLIVTAAPLHGAAGTLAAYREAQGLRTLTADFDDVVDAFSHGIRTPYAIREMLRYASENWAAAPRYLVLAGDGTFDYRDLTGAGDNLVPTLMAMTPDGLFPTDTALADLNGDGLPELSVGRLPALTAQELEGVIAKIISYETDAGGWGGKMILAADDPDPAGDYTAGSEVIAGLVPLHYDLERIYLADTPLAEARTALVSGVNAGRAYVNFLGHGGTDRFAHEGLLTNDDAPSLNGTSGYPVVTAMTCAAGLFAIPGWDSLGELLVRRGGGGAAGLWVPTGYARSDDSVVLAEEFYRAVFLGGETTLGDAILTALGEHRQKGGAAHLAVIYTLFGDPYLQLP